MSEERKDDVQELYDKSNKFEKCINVNFIINLGLSILILFDFKFRDFFIFISMFSNVIYVILTNINEFYFKNEAETERRKSFIKESFNIDITTKETTKYYNNNEEPSIEKLGINCYESVFFTQKIVNKMMLLEIIKIGIIAIIYVILLNQINNFDVLLMATQTLFSAEVLFKFITLCFYRNQLERICKKFEEICFVLGINYENAKVLFLDTTMDYECLKSYCRIPISSKIFFKNNEKWSKEWDKLYKKIKR